MYFKLGLLTGALTYALTR